MKKILFLNLRTFSFTGGIEKFNRAFLKALAELEDEGILTATAFSAYDSNGDQKYFKAEKYRAFNGARLRFVYKAIKTGVNSDTIILSHINLAFIGWIIKKISPSKKIVLVTHGVEVWGKLTGLRKRLIQQSDIILAVSKFTKETIQQVHNIHPERVIVFNNTFDPYFNAPSDFKKPEYLLNRYGLRSTDSVVFTLTRLVYTEKAKGYDKVMTTFPLLREKFPNSKYLLSGKWDEHEKARIDLLISKNLLEKDLILTGFIKDEEVVDHFLLADVFILPSLKEGFGIVFIEAMACGLPVIAGNKDGSVDALKSGELGLLVDPEDETEIFNTLQTSLNNIAQSRDVDKKKKLQQKVYRTFGFNIYKKNLQKILA